MAFLFSLTRSISTLRERPEFWDALYIIYLARNFARKEISRDLYLARCLNLTPLALYSRGTRRLPAFVIPPVENVRDRIDEAGDISLHSGDIPSPRSRARNNREKQPVRESKVKKGFASLPPHLCITRTNGGTLRRDVHGKTHVLLRAAEREMELIVPVWHPSEGLRIL